MFQILVIWTTAAAELIPACSCFVHVRVLTGSEVEPESLGREVWAGRAADPGSLEKPHCGSSTHLDNKTWKEG